MTENQVVGMFVGAFLGDMFGAPYEFKSADKIPFDVPITTGGAHNVTLGEYTDDGAMTLAIAESYLAHRQFEPSDIMVKLQEWANTGKYGTRDYAFDIGNTVSRALKHASPVNPYMGTTFDNSSGNGSLMRIAGVLAANHRNPMMAMSESIATSLMTHGNTDIITYTTAFVDELFAGRNKYNYNPLTKHPQAAKHNGTIMQSYNIARWCSNFEDGDEALREAVRYGGDTDTNAAITGMLVGSRYGIECFSHTLLNTLQNKEHIINVAHQLYDLGLTREFAHPTERLLLQPA